MCRKIHFWCVQRGKVVFNTNSLFTQTVSEMLFNQCFHLPVFFAGVEMAGDTPWMCSVSLGLSETVPEFRTAELFILCSGREVLAVAKQTPLQWVLLTPIIFCHHVAHGMKENGIIRGHFSSGVPALNLCFKNVCTADYITASWSSFSLPCLEHGCKICFLW